MIISLIINYIIQNKLPNNTEIIEFKINYINNKIINNSINQFINNNNDLETYLKNNKKLSNDKIKNILTIHNNELKKINYNTDNIKNIWNINFIEFENILGYQKKQNIDFNKIRNKNKLCGLFGKNAQGKSSIISIILFSIFGSIPDIINNDIPNKYNKKLKTNILFNLGTDLYNIQRTIRTVKLFKNNINISENNKVNTNIKIKNLIGDINIIKNTNISLQEQHNNIIYCSNSDKLKILKKILGLDIYELIFNNIKDNIKNLESKYKILNQFISNSKIILNSKTNIVKNIEIYKKKLSYIHILHENHNYFIHYNQINNNLQTLKDNNSLLQQKINKIIIHNYNDKLNKILNEII
jgi:DNA repair exonuclease SbcCD ATPase subunit